MWHIYILVFDLHCYVSAADEIHLHLICFANVNTSSGRFGICPQPDTDEWVEFKNSQVWYWDVSLHGCDTVISHSYALWKFKIVFKFSMCCINVYHWLTIQQNLFVGKFSEPIVIIRRFLFKVTYLLRYKFSLWEEERAMCAMLRYSHFVKKSMQAVQTWSNSNSMHVDVLHETEQRFIAFLISYASCTCVCDMSPLQARCCATPISSRNRFKPYKLDRIATACMLMCCIRQNSVLLLFW